MKGNAEIHVERKASREVMQEHWRIITLRITDEKILTLCESTEGWARLIPLF